LKRKVCEYRFKTWWFRCVAAGSASGTAVRISTVTVSVFPWSPSAFIFLLTLMQPKLNNPYLSLYPFYLLLDSRKLILHNTFSFYKRKPVLKENNVSLAKLSFLKKSFS